MTRRRLIGGTGVALSVWLAGFRGDATSRRRAVALGPPIRPGVDLTAVGARSLVAVHPLPEGTSDDRPTLASFLAELGRRARATSPGGSASDPSVSIGLGPKVVSAIGSNLPGAAELPAFTGDEALPIHRRGGDVHLILHGADATALAERHREIAEFVGTEASWIETGNRPPGPVRNPLGFRDEIGGPTDPLQPGIFLDSGPLAGATIGVVRILDIDHERFAAHTASERAAIIGRRPDGTPLSGGSPESPVDLMARDGAGNLLVPEGAHVRAARRPYSNPGRMLRRTWHRDSPETAGAGMIFLAFQRSLATFTSTQRRLDRHDKLMEHVTVAASGTFLIPPDDGDKFASALFRAV